jgi:protocatechuate 3,4-dioxygenase beta subunit
MRHDEWDSEDDALRGALAPVAETPPGLESRILGRVRRDRRRRAMRWAVPAALAAGAVVAAVALRPSPSSPPPLEASGHPRFDPLARRLSLPDGSSIVLGEGTQAEFRELPGTRGVVRLTAGDVLCDARSGSSDLVVEGPGLRARTRGGRFVATTRHPEEDSMNASTVATAALVYLASGHVDVDEGPKPNVVQQKVLGRLIEDGSRSGEVRQRMLSLVQGVPIFQQAVPAPAAGEWRISGIVVDGAGAPIRGADVEVRDSSAILAAVRSGDDGRFVAEKIADGELTLFAKAHGFLKTTATAAVAGANLDVPPIVMKPSFAIRGRVVDRWGAPVAGAQVSVERTPPPGEPVETRARLDALTNDMVYTMIQTQAQGQTKSVIRAATQAVVGKQVARTQLLLKEAVTLEGKDLTLNFDAPARFEGLNRLVMSFEVARADAQTRANGSFEIQDLDDGAYTVRAALAEWIDVSGPVEARAPADDVTLVLAHGGEIRGTVYGPDGAPYPGARVNDVLADADGRFRIAGLASGSVDVYAGPADLQEVVCAPAADDESKPVFGDVPILSQVFLRAKSIDLYQIAGARPSRPGLAVRRDVAVHEGETVEGVDLRLPASRTLEGTVVDDLGRPIAGATVTFRAAEDIPHFDSSRTATTDASGAFRIGEAFDVAGTLQSEADGHLAVEPTDAASDARIVLPRAASLHGRATAAGSLVLADAEDAASVQVHRVELPNDEGEFRLDGLHPGRYVAEFVAGEEHVALGTIVLLPGETLELGEVR